MADRLGQPGARHLREHLHRSALVLTEDLDGTIALANPNDLAEGHIAQPQGQNVGKPPPRLLRQLNPDLEFVGELRERLGGGQPAQIGFDGAGHIVDAEAVSGGAVPVDLDLQLRLAQLHADADIPELRQSHEPSLG